jgi:hypothetical protein
MTRRWLVCSLLVALFVGPPTLLAPLLAPPTAKAEDAPKKSIDDYGVEKAPAGTEMPTFTGKGKVHQAINGDIGAIFDIGGGITMTFPKGLPVGRSRLVTLQKGRGSLPGKLAGPKWKGLGPVLDFSGTFTTSRQPIVLTVPSKKSPASSGMRLVVAMEVGTFCEGDHKAHKLGGGLCSGFELHDAEHDPAGGRLVAKLRSTGGHRMQFGLVADE